MNPTELSKLNRFANDIQMRDAVREVIECEIMKPTKDRDVQNLSARYIALEILRDAFKEIDRYKDIQDVEQNKSIKYV
jgi:hypothetical protein